VPGTSKLVSQTVTAFTTSGGSWSADSDIFDRRSFSR
jgi:hypothetical protein